MKEDIDTFDIDEIGDAYIYSDCSTLDEDEIYRPHSSKKRLEDYFDDQELRRQIDKFYFDD